jgi:uncharacterized protein YyaL (SSP411 family)
LQDSGNAGFARDELDALTATVLADVARDDGVDPTALTFLLRRYVDPAADAQRDQVADALGRALALALDQYRARQTGADRAAWLTLFSEARALSDDERLQTATADLIDALRRDASTAPSTDLALAAVDACLRAAAASADPKAVVASAIDQLEHVVGHVYRPGEGVAHIVDRPDGVRGRLQDQVQAASALLTAFAITGRLPYAMLAEELMQTARRGRWDDRSGGFFDGESGTAEKPFAANCHAARVLSRLAALHRDDEYRAAAILVADADYGADAARLLVYLSSAADARGNGAAVLGLALAEYVNLK